MGCQRFHTCRIVLLSPLLLLLLLPGSAVPAGRTRFFASAGTPTPDYHFDSTISRVVLDNYLSRSISMEGLLNGRGDLDDNIRMLHHTGAKFIGRSLCLWGHEADLEKNFERAKIQVPKV